MGRTPRGITRAKIREFMRKRLLAGDPPSVREVQQAFGFQAVESARAHLRALVQAGELVHLPGRARGYRLPDRLGESALVPLLGRVQAGALTEAIEDPEGYLQVQESEEDAQLFALRVQGKSMIDAGILPGDLVIVRRQPTAQAGEIVVALVDQEATVKTLQFKGSQVVLQPQNPSFAALEPGPGEVQILGKVIEVRRYLEGNAAGRPTPHRNTQ